MLLTRRDTVKLSTAAAGMLFGSASSANSQTRIIQAAIDPDTAGRYANFYRDIDARTEYFNLYELPESENLIPSYRPWWEKARSLWHDYALAEDGPLRADARDRLLAEINTETVANGLRTMDEALRRLVEAHFPSDEGPDLQAYLMASRLFGQDALPPDPDRLARVIARGDPTDPRLGRAGRHTMDSPIMWFNWAGFLESAWLLEPDEKMNAVRKTQLVGAAVGSAFDFTTRNRGATRGEYYGANGANVIMERVQDLATVDDAVNEIHELRRILAAGVPVAAVASQKPLSGEMQYSLDRYTLSQ